MLQQYVNLREQRPEIAELPGMTVLNSQVTPLGSGLYPPDVYAYAFGDKPFGAFLKGATDKIVSSTQNVGGNTLSENFQTAPPQEEPTFMQKYGLYLIGGSLLAVVGLGITVVVMKSKKK